MPVAEIASWRRPLWIRRPSRDLPPRESETQLYFSPCAPTLDMSVVLDMSVALVLSSRYSMQVVQGAVN